MGIKFVEAPLMNILILENTLPKVHQRGISPLGIRYQEALLMNKKGEVIKLPQVH